MIAAEVSARPQATARDAWLLLAGNTLDSVGVGIFFPILPIYASSRGASGTLVGAIMMAGVAGSGIWQIPGGWLADRVDRRRLVIASLALYGLCFPLYLLPVPVWALFLVRLVHTVPGGAYSPAALAMLADLTPVADRGRMFGRWTGSFMLGLLVGPAIGGVVAFAGLGTVFLGSAVVLFAAAALLLRLPASPPRPRAEAAAVRVPLRPLLVILLPVIAASAGANFGVGIYDAVWSLYLKSRGATPLVVGLSFTVLALPVVLLSSWAGSLADRYGPRRIVSLNLVGMGVFASAYGLISSVPWLVGLNSAEGATIAGGRPALLAIVSRSVPPSQQGQAQGTYQSCLMAVQAVGALVGGALFSVGGSLPFFAITAGCVGSLLAVPFLGREAPVAEEAYIS